MCSQRNAVTWVLLIGFAVLLVSRAETYAATQTSTVTKDPAAVAALKQMIAATGWNPSTLPADAVVTGVVTPVGQSSSSVTLKMKGLAEFRVDTQTGAGGRSIILNNGQIALTLPDGTSQSLPIQDAVSIWPVDVPVFSGLPLAASSTAVSVTGLGTEVVNGVSCNKVQITSQVDPTTALGAITSKAASIVVWLDASTGLPAQLQYTRIASDNSSATISHIRQFSNYQAVDGMQFALTQQEFVGGQLRFTLQLSSVNLNVGLTDADFLLPSVQ